MAGPWRIEPTHEDEAPVSFSSCLRRTGKMQGTAAPEVNGGAAATPAGEGSGKDRRGRIWSRETHSRWRQRQWDPRAAARATPTAATTGTCERKGRRGEREMEPREKGEMEGQGDGVGLEVNGGGSPEGAEGGGIGRAGGELPIQIEQSARERRRTGLRAHRVRIGPGRAGCGLLRVSAAGRSEVRWRCHMAAGQWLETVKGRRGARGLVRGAPAAAPSGGAGLEWRGMRGRGEVGCGWR